jgi:hypothetical protein
MKGTSGANPQRLWECFFFIMQELYSMISYISFFRITETAIKWLEVKLEKLKHGALSASSAKSVRL